MRNISPDSNLFKYKTIPFYGRTLDEYKRFFQLKPEELIGKKVLDTPSGASSFVSEACKMGIEAVACDLVFDEDIDTLSQYGKDDIDHVIEKVTANMDLFKWEFYDSLQHLKECRTKAFTNFISDYKENRNRYVKAELPHLPFEDNSFHLALSGHFLFTHSHSLDYNFHLQTITELFRVANQVRIYPLVELNTKLYHKMDQLFEDLKDKGATCQIIPVDFEFQKGANEMLLLTH